jgi:hypothetical protein
MADDGLQTRRASRTMSQSDRYYPTCMLRREKHFQSLDIIDLKILVEDPDEKTPKIRKGRKKAGSGPKLECPQPLWGYHVSL